MQIESVSDMVRQAFVSPAADAVVSAYLFGSHARRAQHAESDVDVGVLLDREKLPTRGQRFDRGTRIASTLMAELREPRIDVVVLNDAPPVFARKVVLDGLRVYCADSEGDHAFVRDVQLRAADLEPFLRRTRALKLQALSVG